MSERKGDWRFSAEWSQWTFPEHMVATTSTDPSSLKNELQQMEAERKCLVLELQRFSILFRNIQLKHKRSDWELACIMLYI
jgi:hypothetical protein